MTMYVVQICATIVILSLYIHCGQCFIEVASLAGGAVSAIVGSLCFFKECCTDDYITDDLKLLKSSLETSLHAQHLAADVVLNALEHHIHNASPKRALTLSFHGSSGTGKNLMVNLIVDALYKEGGKSNYVHYYNGHLDFHLEKQVSRYKDRIKEEITEHLRSCPRSIFIFDKVDHIPNGILDVLMQFLDFNPRMLKVVPTRAIFVFISNTGADLIEKELIRMWESGKKRGETELQDFEPLLANHALNGEGGFHKSEIIKMNFMDHYVPFLPLEEIHVRKCIDDTLKKIDSEPETDSKLTALIDEAMTHITFGPSPHNLYSESGCKRVNSKVSMIVKRRQQTR